MFAKLSQDTVLSLYITCTYVQLGPNLFTPTESGLALSHKPENQYRPIITAHARIKTLT
jgi:hypothetical protein